MRWELVEIPIIHKKIPLVCNGEKYIVNAYIIFISPCVMPFENLAKGRPQQRGCLTGKP